MTVVAVERDIDIAEQNKNTIRRYVETWNRGDLEGVFQFWSPKIVHHTRASSHGYDVTKQIVAGFTLNFPGMRFEIDDMIAEGDKVVTRMTWRAPHTTSYMGSVPDNQEIACTVLGIARLENGKIVEHWGVTDELAMLAQIGLLPREHLTAMG